MNLTCLHQGVVFREFKFYHLHLVILAKFVLPTLRHWYQKFSPVSWLTKNTTSCLVCKLRPKNQAIGRLHSVEMDDVIEHGKLCDIIHFLPPSSPLREGKEFGYARLPKHSDRGHEQFTELDNQNRKLMPTILNITRHLDILKYLIVLEVSGVVDQEQVFGKAKHIYMYVICSSVSYNSHITRRKIASFFIRIS